jgi:dolichol-phosphate mannosyltransferase
MARRATVVVPTHNEEGCIARLTESLLLDVFPMAHGWQLSLLVVDGHSTDRTVEIVEKLQRSHEGLFLIVEERKEGIGAAYVKGFTFAIEKLHAEVVIEFDGDLQHPPSSVLGLLGKIDQGYDYVVGSRRMKPGGNPPRWGLRRRFLSNVGGRVARFVLFFPFREFFAVTDPTSGLKASRVKGFLDQIDYHNLITHGFGYKLELLARMLAQGARYTEIPLRFGLRESGESKITKQTAKEIMLAVVALRIRDERTARFLKFCLVGFAGFLINAAMLELFRKLNVTSWISRSLVGQELSRAFTFMKERSAWAAALSAEAAIVSNFIFNNAWTFSGQRGTSRSILKTLGRFALFNVTSLGAIVIQFVCVGLAVWLFGDRLGVRQAALIGSILLLVVPYDWVMYNVVIWRKENRSTRPRFVRALSVRQGSAHEREGN